MINEIRNLTLSILNKENQGYLTPLQFNLFAHAAQVEIFQQLSYEYSKSVNRRNKFLHTSGLGDIPKRIAEVIDRFRFQSPLTYNAISLRFEIPDDTFSLGIVYLSATNVEVDIVDSSKVNGLLLSNDTYPTTRYPIGHIVEGQIQVYPTSINSTGSLIANYIRYPATPKWTYTSISGGEPIFNQAAFGYQDFELPEEYMYSLTTKILAMAGVEMREEEIVRFAKSEETQSNQEQLQ